MKIKNISGQILQLHSHEFQIDEILEIEESLLNQWSDNDDVIEAIVNKLIQIHSNFGPIESISIQIDYLKNRIFKVDKILNETVIEFSNKYFIKSDAIYYNCPANEVTFIDMLVDNKLKESEILSDENFECKFLRGGSVFGKNIEFGDWCKLQVVDKDGILVQMGHLTQEQFDAMKVDGAIVLKEYIVKRYAMPNEKEVIRVDAPGQIPVGSYLRCIYHATNSGNTREIYINYDIENLDSPCPF